MFLMIRCISQKNIITLILTQNLRMRCRTAACWDNLQRSLHFRTVYSLVLSKDSNNIRKVMSSREITEKSLGLEPLGDKVIAYFAGRMISEGTLRRNSVMQLSGDQDVIALPFKQNGVLVGCKYRTCREKKFWQVKGTQKWLFGLDDIKDADEIIIVEGEIDKLAMEEAGFLNCVSVPCGAPQKVSAKELPPQEKDTGYQYVWNCKEHLDKVSRIILATDGDIPGQALAEELARRLGKERCWRVQWPKKDEFCCFKDANEVLMFLGRDALKEVIDNAELYQLQVPEQAMQCA
ncbi:primase homolog protein-like isoform X1 [Mangifera indica]|uniref:primase homolog protein-like isoform X1 n=2 Tax=Mangifera indica TaxID=29780 RepID=UPI001CFA7AD6|nr:primase homolog protein-like isoform X1 [Mangifera indica]